jgi:hypothetical protein
MLVTFRVHAMKIDLTSENDMERSAFPYSTLLHKTAWEGFDEGHDDPFLSLGIHFDVALTSTVKAE